jgi:hypothetical protein
MGAMYHGEKPRGTPRNLARNFSRGLALWIHCVHGVVVRGDPRWSVGMGVLALNTTAWVVAIGIFGAAAP